MKKSDTGSMSLGPGVLREARGTDLTDINSFGLVGFWFGVDVDVGVYLVYSL